MKRSLLLLALLSATAAAAAEYTVTAYCPCAKCCGRANQPAADGRRPQAGVTVAGPRRIPLGTRVFIAGLGVRTVTDRLAARYDNRFDVFVRSHAEARRFGLRHLQVTILTQAP